MELLSQNNGELGDDPRLYTDSSLIHGLKDFWLIRLKRTEEH